jgi:hypothetical protein
MRREAALAGHRIAASGGHDEQGPESSCSLARARTRGRGDSPVGHDWLPGGLYTPAGRGSIPRWSTSSKIANT